VAISSPVVRGLVGGVWWLSMRWVVRVWVGRRRIRGGLLELASGDTGTTGPLVVTLLVVDWRRRGRSSTSPPVPVVRGVELALLAPEKISVVFSAVSRALLAVCVAR
jgi:hypothetical protein